MEISPSLSYLLIRRSLYFEDAHPGAFEPQGGKDPGESGEGLPPARKAGHHFQSKGGHLSQPQPCLANQMPLNKENIFLTEAFIGTRMSFMNKKSLF